MQENQRGRPEKVLVYRAHVTRFSESCLRSTPAPLSRITSAPTTVLERQQLYRSRREHRDHSHGQNLEALESHRIEDNNRGYLIKSTSKSCEMTVFSRIEEAVVLTEFQLYNAALERLQQIYLVTDNIVRFLVGKVSYKLGKNNSRTDLAAWYLEQSVLCFQGILDTQPDYLAARLYRTRSFNRLYVLKHKLVPLISTKYTKKSLQLQDLKASESKFKQAVAVALEINRQSSPSCIPENYSNFKLKIVPERMLKTSIWAMMKTAGELLKYQRYLEGLEMVTSTLKLCTNPSLYFIKSKCLIGIRNHQLVDRIPTDYNIIATNICDVIITNLTMSCRLSKNCDYKVLFEFGRFLGTTSKVIEAVNQLKVRSKRPYRLAACAPCRPHFTYKRDFNLNLGNYIMRSGYRTLLLALINA